MRRSTYRPVSDHEATIRRLKGDLWEAQFTVLEMLPEDVNSVLHSYRDCASIEDTHVWLYDVADDLIAFAKPLASVHPMFGRRGNCPLCGRGSNSPYDEGFALPEGLRMHLQGKGNAARCSIIKMALGLARHDWDERFHPPLSREHEALQAELKARRAKELQYLINPYVMPFLIDEFGRYTPTRSAAAIELAEQRLTEMGFLATTKGRVRTYTKETQNAVAYADPRVARAIAFAVVLKPIQDGLQRWEIRRIPVEHFSIPDGWKKGLEKKVDEAIDAAVKKLMPALKLVG